MSEDKNDISGNSISGVAGSDALQKLLSALERPLESLEEIFQRTPFGESEDQELGESSNCDAQEDFAELSTLIATGSPNFLRDRRAFVLWASILPPDYGLRKLSEVLEDFLSYGLETTCLVDINQGVWLMPSKKSLETLEMHYLPNWILLDRIAIDHGNHGRFDRRVLIRLYGKSGMPSDSVDPGRPLLGWALNAKEKGMTHYATSSNPPYITTACGTKECHPFGWIRDSKGRQPRCGECEVNMANRTKCVHGSHWRSATPDDT